uniref:Putative ovule protein n=1 Tax=Solanum chacoense TaxID=4108 RepID=A0A0V0GXT0_SOLCH
MGREDPQYIKVSYNKNNTDMPQAHTETPGKTNWRNKGVEKDNHNSSHEVIQEGMSNGEDSQSTPLQIDTSCTRDFQGLQEGTSPVILMMEDVAIRDPNETTTLIETRLVNKWIYGFFWLRQWY